MSWEALALILFLFGVWLALVGLVRDLGAYMLDGLSAVRDAWKASRLATAPRAERMPPPTWHSKTKERLPATASSGAARPPYRSACTPVALPRCEVCGHTDCARVVGRREEP